MRLKDFKEDNFVFLFAFFLKGLEYFLFVFVCMMSSLRVNSYLHDIGVGKADNLHLYFLDFTHECMISEIFTVL